jgi:hypothetical protein
MVLFELVVFPVLTLLLAPLALVLPLAIIGPPILLVGVLLGAVGSSILGIHL